MTKHNYNIKLDIPQDADSARYFIPEGYAARIEGGVLIIEPEESEGEKIRKEIVSFIRDFWVDHRDSVPQTSKWLDWLEKQKEQKPVEKQNYSGLSDLERAIHRGFLVAGVENLPRTIIEETAKDCLAQMKLAEWSEEDKRKLNRIYAIIGQAADTHAFSTTCRLIGDKEAVELQDFLRSIAKPKSEEWSEEDEKWFEEIELMVLYFTDDEKYREKFISWLKSLKNRGNFPQSNTNSPSWKPSEEQMKDLFFAAKLNTILHPSLNALYEQLKKLM